MLRESLTEKVTFEQSPETGIIQASTSGERAFQIEGKEGGGSEPGMNLVSLRGNKGAVWLKKRMSKVRAVRMRLDGQQGDREELGFE